MSSHISGAGARPRRRTFTLWVLLALCAAPIVASYLAYYVWRPSGHINYGDLIAPARLPDDLLETSDGKPFRWSDLKGEWVLLTIDVAECDERCRMKLVYTRQVRLAQGQDSDRVERVWLVTDRGAPAPDLLAQHPELRVIRDRRNQIAAMLPAPRSPLKHIYIIDPLGNLMMRFPADPDPRRMLRDVSRLLRHSKWK